MRLLGRRSCLMPGRHRRALELRRKVPVPRKKALEHHRKLPEHRRRRKELRSHRSPPSWSRNLRCHLLHQARSRWGGPIGRGALRKVELNFKVNLRQELLTEEQECANEKGRDEVDGKDGVGEEDPG